MRSTFSLIYDALLLMLLGAILSLLFIWVLTEERIPSTARDIPRCTEDVVLMGGGQFIDGRYETYGCGPAMDDYTWTP